MGGLNGKRDHAILARDRCRFQSAGNNHSLADVHLLVGVTTEAVLALNGRRLPLLVLRATQPLICGLAGVEEFNGLGGDAGPIDRGGVGGECRSGE